VRGRGAVAQSRPKWPTPPPTRTSAATPAAAAAKKSRRAKPRKSTDTVAEPRLSRTRRPAALPVAHWQAALRRQFGREQPFKQRNLGAAPVFSSFRVDNPESDTHYHVTIRGLAPGHSQCSCWDYATNPLGTCKHIEFVLGCLLAKRAGRIALARGEVAPYSEVRLTYLGARQIRFHAGSGCPAALLAQARLSFDAGVAWMLPWSRLDAVGNLARAAEAAGHELRVGDDVWAFIAQVRDAEQR
jgi:hypothetical protein